MLRPIYEAFFWKSNGGSLIDCCLGGFAIAMHDMLDSQLPEISCVVLLIADEAELCTSIWRPMPCMVQLVLEPMDLSSDARGRFERG